MARPRISARDKKVSFSTSQDRQLVRNLDDLADFTGLDRSKIIGDIMEKNFNDYKDAMDYIDSCLNESRVTMKGFCSVCARAEYMDSGKITPEKHVLGNSELISVRKVIESNNKSPNFGKQLSSQFDYKCKQGHKVGMKLDVFEGNPFKGKNELKNELKPTDLKVKE
jgi:hypothetical protein